MQDYFGLRKLATVPECTGYVAQPSQFMCPGQHTIYMRCVFPVLLRLLSDDPLFSPTHIVNKTPVKVSAVQIRAIQMSAANVRAGKMGEPDICTGEPGTVKPSALDMCACKVNALHSDEVQVPIVQRGIYRVGVFQAGWSYFDVFLFKLLVLTSYPTIDYGVDTGITNRQFFAADYH